MTTVAPAPTQAAASSTARAVELTNAAVTLLVLGHIALGIVATALPGVATYHAVVTVVAFLAILAFARTPTPILLAVAYTAGIQVFWRAAEARFFWEGPKYLVVLASLVIFLRFIRSGTRAVLPVVYMAVLLPAVVLSVVSATPNLREVVSFNLSGPASLAAFAAVCASLRATWPELRALLWALVVPLATMASYVAVSIGNLDNIRFGTESIRETSGGFGPNQVSAALALGAFLCLVLYNARSRGAAATRAIAACLGAWLMFQATLTFSRGGVLSAVLAAGAFLLGGSLRSGRRGRVALLAVGLVVVGVMLFNQLDQVTEGALTDRYSQASSTGRADIASDDLRLFREHLLTGVGVGRAASSRGLDALEHVVAHTEFTRLLAEHGLLGAVAMAVLLVLGRLAVLRQSPLYRGLSSALVVWVAATMLHAAMRLSLVSVMFGIALLRVTQSSHRSRDDG